MTREFTVEEVHTVERTWFYVHFDADSVITRMVPAEMNGFVKEIMIRKYVDVL